MKREILRTIASVRDVDSIAAFIADENEEAAFRFLESTQETLQLLLKMPEMGAKRTYSLSAFPELRMFPVKSFPKYLIFYRPTENGVEVLRILHSARDIIALFE